MEPLYYDEVSESISDSTISYSIASFGDRVIVRLVDLLIWAIVGGSVFYYLLTNGYLRNLDFSRLTNYPRVFIFLYLFGPALIAVIVRAIFESSRFQGTPAKIIFKMKVIDRDDNRISFPRALARNFGKFLSGLFIFIGFIPALFDHNRQTMHDMAASTYVIRED